MRATLAILIVSAVLTTGCANFPPVLTGQPVAERTLKDDQAMYVAEIAWKGALTAVDAAERSGQLKGERAAKAAAIVRRGSAVMKELRAAYALGNAVQEGRIFSLIADLQLAGVKP